MRYAVDENKSKIEVTFSGERAKCPNCNSIVIGRKGSFKVKHWYHKSKTNCDSWSEPITEWHLKWQNFFPKEYREVSIQKDGAIKTHRADIRLKNGLVIEVQNSPISIEQIEERESFYGKENMIWIINGSTLASNSRLSFELVRKKHELIVEIPSECEKVPNYDMDEFKMNLWKDKNFFSLYSSTDLINFNESNGNYFVFEFSKSKNFEEIERQLTNLFIRVSDKIYGNRAYPKLMWDLSVKYIDIPRDYYSHISLDKKYWRKFIDSMKFPVFIDNLKGQDEDMIYWYQENRIIKVSNFINKYLRYT